MVTHNLRRLRMSSKTAATKPVQWSKQNTPLFPARCHFMVPVSNDRTTPTSLEIWIYPSKARQNATPKRFPSSDTMLQTFQENWWMCPRHGLLETHSWKGMWFIKNLIRVTYPLLSVRSSSEDYFIFPHICSWAQTKPPGSLLGFFVLFWYVFVSVPRAWCLFAIRMAYGALV